MPPSADPPDALSRVRARARTLVRALEDGDRAAALLCLLFVAALLPLLPDLQHNYDEGVYIQQALLVMDGWLPYRDFFCHQTPLHVLTLAAFAWPAPDALLLYRLPSLLATALGAFLVYRIARELVSKPAALAACLLCLVTTVQFYGLLALPNALMLTCSTAAVLLGCFRRGRRSAALAGVLLAVAVLYKPLAVATGAAVGLAMLLDAERRRDVPIFVLAGAATGLVAFLLFDVASDGAFRELLSLQLSRYGSRAGFETMRGLGPMQEVIRSHGVDSALGWNWHEHVRAVSHVAEHRNNSGLVAGAAALGAVGLWLAPEARVRRARPLLLLWWGLPLAADLWLWEPVWDHYLMQYVPPMALLTATVGERLRTRAWGRALAAAFLAIVTPMAVSHVWLRHRPLVIPLYASLTNQRWLTFDPFINFVTGTTPACGLIDPFNVYGDHSLLAPRSGEPPPRFHVTAAELIACLDWDPKIRVGIGTWADVFVDEQLRAYLAGQPPERFLPGSQYGPDDPRRDTR